VFKSLEFTVTFASTGRTISGTHTFAEGITAITGANEQGKSMRLEMLRFALFGVDALRATSSEYTKLHATCAFDVDGIAYRVVRKSTTALYRGEEQVASGVKAVNLKIVETLGYGLEIFDLVNNCAQGEVERLSSLRPAQRKALIERTAGLEAVDVVIKKVKAEAEGLAQEAKGARLGLADVGPMPKEPPEVAATAHVDLKATIVELTRQMTERHQAEGVLQLPLPKIPSIPSVTPLPEHLTVDQYESIKADLQGIAITRRLITDKEAEAARIVPPDLTEAELEALEALLEQQPALREAWAAFERREALMKAGEMVCPSCNTSFFVEHEHLAALPEVPQPAERAMDAKMVDYQRRAIATQRQRHADAARKAALLAEAAEVKALLDGGPSETTLRARLGQIEEHLRQVRAREQALAAAQAAQESQQALQQRQDEARAVLAATEGVDAALRAAREALTIRQAYELQVQAWLDATNRNKELATKIAALESEAEAWAAGVAALQALKARVKGYLAPSLSAIASSYLARMTDGARTSVRVSDDFAIVVDGQPVETLSGSGKAVANLALRVALGLVLSSKRFSVFLGDEVDASMDENRAESTVEALRALRGQIKQIILVSHKRTEADHQLAL